MNTVAKLIIKTHEVSLGNGNAVCSSGPWAIRDTAHLCCLGWVRKDRSGVRTPPHLIPGSCVSLGKLPGISEPHRTRNICPATKGD